MSNHIASKSVPPEIQTVLQRLRSRLRRYIFLEGVALVLVVLSLLFWLSLGLDWGYFQLSRLELPVAFRQTFAILTICLFVLSVMSWLILRLAKKMHQKALALVLEKRFPELNDRLITAVELEDSLTGKETRLTTEMVNRTVREVSSASQQLELGSVFDKKPLRRAILLAVVLVSSVVGFGVANANALDRWKRAFVNWDEVYWNRNTALEAKIVAQPNDTLKEFKEFAYKHPRGADLDVRVFVAKDTKQPESVELSYEKAEDRGEAEVPMSQLNDSEFKVVIPNLRDDLTFRVRGGDFTNRILYKVVIVDPPAVENLFLHNEYPNYTGLNSDPLLKDIKVRGNDPALPLGTNFQFHIQTNKALQGAILETTTYEVHLEAEETYALIFDRQGQEKKLPFSSELQKVMRDAAKKSDFRIHFRLVPSADAANELESLQGEITESLPLSAAADEQLRVYLHDADDIMSRDPYRISIRGIVDQAPKMITRLRGVRNKITRLAKIPVAGEVSDDYGLKALEFQYFIREAGVEPAPIQPEQWEHQSFAVPYAGYLKEYRLGPAEAKEEKLQVEKFDVDPFKLTTGQSITLTVLATDGDNLWGPNEQRSETHEFEIVSKGELLMIIYGDQLTLLQQFAEVVKKVQRVRDDLNTSLDDIDKVNTLRKENELTPEQITAMEKLDQNILGTAELGLHDLRTSSLDSLSVENTFRDLLLEMENNGIDDKKVTERVETKLLAPLSKINGSEIAGLEDQGRVGLFEQADRSLGLFRVAQENAAKQGDPSDRLTDSIEDLDILLKEMRLVLKEIEELIKFNNAAQKLQAILDDELELEKDTKDARKKKILGGTGLPF